MRCEIFTTIKVIATSTPSPHPMFLVRTLQLYPFSKCQIYSTVCFTVVPFTLGFQNSFILHNRKFASLDKNLPISPSPQPLVTTILLHFYKFGYFWFNMYVQSHSICLSVSDLFQLASCPPDSPAQSQKADSPWINVYIHTHAYVCAYTVDYSLASKRKYTYD